MKSFKESLIRLNEINEILNSGNCEREEAMDLYSEGVGLIKDCNIKLNAAKEKLDENV